MYRCSLIYVLGQGATLNLQVILEANSTWWNFPKKLLSTPPFAGAPGKGIFTVHQYKWYDKKQSLSNNVQLQFISQEQDKLDNLEEKRIRELNKEHSIPSNCEEIKATCPKYQAEFILSRLSAKEAIGKSLNKPGTLVKAELKKYMRNLKCIVPHSIAVPYFHKIYLRTGNSTKKNNLLISLDEYVKVSISHDGLVAASVAWTRKGAVNLAKLSTTNRVLNQTEYANASRFRSGSYGVDVIQIRRLLRFLRRKELFGRFCDIFAPQVLHKSMKNLYVLFLQEIGSTGSTLPEISLNKSSHIRKLVFFMALCFSLSECLVKAFRSRVRFSFARDFSVSCLSIDQMNLDDLVNGYTNDAKNKVSVRHTVCGKVSWGSSVIRNVDADWQRVDLRGEALEALLALGWKKCSFLSLVFQGECSENDLWYIGKESSLCTVIRFQS